MRCLLISPDGVNLNLLLAALHEYGVEVSSTSDLGAGVALARAALDDVDFGIAVLPSRHEEHRTAIPAVYMEIGVAASRGVPLLVIVEPPALPSPALAGLTTVTTRINNADVLRLHVGLFLRSVASAPTRSRPQPPTSPATSISVDYRARLQTIRTSPSSRRGLEFEQLVLDLLREAGAQAEASVRVRGGDDGVDAAVDLAAFVPGEERRLGTLLIDVKSGGLTRHALQRAQEKLSTQVVQRRGGLGLLIYDGVLIGPERLPSTPLVFCLAIDQLLSELEHRPLRDVLVQARNRAIHGM